MVKCLQKWTSESRNAKKHWFQFAVMTCLVNWSVDGWVLHADRLTPSFLLSPAPHCMMMPDFVQHQRGLENLIHWIQTPGPDTTATRLNKYDQQHIGVSKKIISKQGACGFGSELIYILSCRDSLEEIWHLVTLSLFSSVCRTKFSLKLNILGMTPEGHL